MAFKDTVVKWARSGPQALVVAAAVALVLGGAIGLGAGYKIEKNRTLSDVHRLEKQAKANGSNTKAGPLGQRLGKVTSVADGMIVVTTPKAGTQTVAITAATKIDKTASGSVSDIIVGHNILIATGDSEVIVLPADSALGRRVTVISGDSYTIAAGNRAPAGKVQRSLVKTVETVSAAKPTDIKTGDAVLVGGRSISTSIFGATELILLPSNSAFVR